jgi:hypothetical protein
LPFLVCPFCPPPTFFFYVRFTPKRFKYFLSHR